MKPQLIFVLFALLLAACGPAATPAPTIDATALFNQVDATVRAQLTETTAHQPTLTMTITPAVAPSLPPPTPLPTEAPLPILTPDAYQVEHWKEYQTELAKVLLADYFLGDSVALALCEWDILGRSDQEVYVWAYCSPRNQGGSGSRPAVIYLKNDGAVQNVKVPGRGSMWASNMIRLFPEEVREKIDLYYFNNTFAKIG